AAARTVPPFASSVATTSCLPSRLLPLWATFRPSPRGNASDGIITDDTRWVVGPLRRTVARGAAPVPSLASLPSHGPLVDPPDRVQGLGVGGWLSGLWPNYFRGKFTHLECIQLRGAAGHFGVVAACSGPRPVVRAHRPRGGGRKNFFRAVSR